MKKIFHKYHKTPDKHSVAKSLESIQTVSKQIITKDVLKSLFSYIDLTFLNTDDNEGNIVEICDKLNNFPKEFNHLPSVAAICLYPSLVHIPKRNLKVGVKIASVAGGFPSSQTFTEVKTIEAEMAVKAGATEIDMVISAGKFLAGEYKQVAAEITAIKKSIGNAHLKVILETGILRTNENIRKASLLAMQAGADFIKTSTGKGYPAASYEAVYIMADAAADFYKETGRKVGIKPAGGITDTEQALTYSLIIEKVLGEEWLTQDLFRIGASRLANNLLSSIRSLELGETVQIKYF